ncbi:amino acid ABC transporter substrate-binding protein [Silvanigrella aquatica]|uniref:Amino acid ABC transporter substrate-binding protein n=1 Tax=Silvanigrella aquatica TaxID=1915309 RepID=A0A1L4D4P0_9BACT|nr:amino acid ABC transporter substrate-binding protein [Silvanigrella aquatica]
MSRFCLKIFVLIISILISPFLYAAKNFKIVTENYPPFNMEENGKIVGISTDVMKELMKREKTEYTLELYPWARAFKMGMEEPNTVVYSTTRTPEREALFKWVGPLVSNDWVFFAKKGSKIKIKSLDDAKKYSVGGYNGDATSEFLLKENFVKGKNIQLATNDKQNALKLEAGRIDLWATGSQIGKWIAKTEKTGSIEPLFTFKKVELYAAFNKNTDDAVIKKLNETLDKMKKDGSVTKIFDRYK